MTHLYHGPDWETPRCPVCLAEADSVYVDGDGEIHGCDGCLKRMDAWELPPRFDGRAGI